MAEITYGMNQSLMMSNVLSVNYNIVGDEIEVAFQDMIQTAVAAGYTPKKQSILLMPPYRRIGRWNLQHHSLSSRS